MLNNLYGEVRRRPERIYGDSAYDTDGIRDRLGVKANMPVNPGNGGRQIPYDEEGYGVMRPAIEGFNAWLKASRRAVVKYEGLAVIFQAIATFACIVIYVRYGL